MAFALPWEPVWTMHWQCAWFQDENCEQMVVPDTALGVVPQGH